MSLMLFVVLVAALLIAWTGQSPEPLAVHTAGQGNAGHAAEMPFAMLRVIIPLTLTLGLLLLLVSGEVRRRRGRAADQPSLPALAPPPTRSEGTSSSSGLLPATGSAMGLATAEPFASTTQTRPPTLGEDGEKECEICGRIFDTVLSLCPFDGGDLGPKGSAARPVARGEDGLDTSIAQMVCSACDRSFELGVSFCPYDGVDLDRVEDRLPEQETGTICPSCGTLCESDAVFCPIDQTRLHVHSEEDEALLSAAPLKICTVCAKEFAAGLTTCPDCEEPLGFLHGRKTNGLAIDRSNPTRICPTCNTLYLEELSFCAHDGEALAALN